MKNLIIRLNLVLLAAIFSMQIVILIQHQEGRKIRSREFIWSDANGKCYQLINDTLFLNSQLIKEQCK